MKFKLPIKTVSEANKFEHWAKSNKRHQDQKEAVKLVLGPHFNDPTKIWLSCKIILTRIAPRFLDANENLPMAFKYITDAVCELLVPGKAIGQADSDNRIEVTYEQIKGGVKEYAVEIEIISST